MKRTMLGCLITVVVTITSLQSAAAAAFPVRRVPVTVSKDGSIDKIDRKHHEEVSLNSNAECQHDRAQAIDNYRKGKGSIWFFHITHNAGTNWRRLAGMNLKEYKGGPNMKMPWVGNRWFDDAPAMSYALPHEEGMLPYPQIDPMNDTSVLSTVVPCTSDKWVSAITMRDPIGRILSGDGRWTTSGSKNVDSCNTDNYGLRMLIGKDFKKQLTKEDVAMAKRRLDSFDFVLDVGDLTTSMKQMCHELGWKCNLFLLGGSSHSDIRSRVPAEVFDKWVHRNRYELEVYEYAKLLSKRLISTLPDAEEQQQAKSLGEEVVEVADLTSFESNLTWKCRQDACATCNED